MLKRKENTNDTSLNNARILYYDFFAGLFLYDLLLNRADLLKKQIEILKQEPLDEGDLAAFLVIENELCKNGVKNFIFEYTTLFMLPFDADIRLESKDSKNTESTNLESKNSIDSTESANLESTNLDSTDSLPKKPKSRKNKKIIPNPQIVLYLSYYLDKTIAGSGLIKAKEKVRKSKVRLNSDVFKENEEHLGFLLIFIKYLLQNGESSLAKEVFNDCVNPMKNDIIRAIKARNKDSLYSQICTIFGHFLEFEMALNRV